MTQSNRQSAGFTLLETLIVVGLIALLAVGIAGIFNTVGETITRGKRVSEINRTAAQIERVMRLDFEQLTRDGVLFIRNEYARDGQPVSLFDPSRSDAAPKLRARRIDEMVFFARSTTGEFQTARRAMHPDLIARSAEARIYYGHGLRQTPLATSVNSLAARNDRYFRPWLDEPNRPGTNVNGRPLVMTFGEPSVPGIANPNEFASDWGLLRSVTLLVNPSQTSTDIPSDFAAAIGFNPTFLQDNRVQVAMQPAVKSPLRWFARATPRSPGNAWGSVGYRVDSRMAPPWPTSGIVDIATMSLAEMREIINHFEISPDTRPPSELVYAQQFDPRHINDRFLMQDWIREVTPGDQKNEVPGQWAQRTRMRFEYGPPLLAITDAGSELERAYRQADQEMLPASLFVAGCTDFIVEWTYGFVDPDPLSPTYGQLIWYGLPRYHDSNGNNTYDAADPIIAETFPGLPAGDVLPEIGFDGSIPNGALYPTRQLISGGVPPANMNEQPTSGRTEVAMFGSYDPGPDTAGGDPDDPTWTAANPVDDPSDDRPWLWPAMIRVTMSLADRNDPSLEYTYQAVFAVPGGGIDNE